MFFWNLGLKKKEKGSFWQESRKVSIYWCLNDAVLSKQKHQNRSLVEGVDSLSEPQKEVMQVRGCSKERVTCKAREISFLGEGKATGGFWGVRRSKRGESLKGHGWCKQSAGGEGKALGQLKKMSLKEAMRLGQHLVKGGNCWHRKKIVGQREERVSASD